MDTMAADRDEGRRMTALEREQERLLSNEDLRPYKGQWVALRDGRVVASHVDPVALEDHPEVRADDMLVPVPDQGSDILIA